MAGIEEEEEEDLPAYQIVGRELLTVASCRHTSTGLLILFLMLLMGMAHSVVPTVFYWYVTFICNATSSSFTAIAIR